MLIARNTVVTLKYSVRDTDGASIDEGTAPLVYLHGGYGGIFDRIEEELQGKAEGDVLEVKLEPEDAFGEYDADLVAIESRQLFPDNIEVGMQFERGAEDDESEDGLFTITDIADDKVVVDGNHPLAGISLLFSCTVAGVRAATDEEITHGHVHGDHGHHH
jgi:FKBP-type peptidyl-prolyl cis-trans isomerase SlyD